MSSTNSTVDDHDLFCWQRDLLDVVKFSKCGVWGKVPEGSTLLFEDIQTFPYYTMWDSWKEASVQKTARFVQWLQSFRYNIGLWRTGRRTHDDSKYRASIASHGKNWSVCRPIAIQRCRCWQRWRKASHGDPHTPYTIKNMDAKWKRATKSVQAYTDVT